MELKIARLKSKLLDVGFKFLRTCPQSGDRLFVRKWKDHEIYDRLKITFAGKNNEAVVVYLIVSVIECGYPSKGLLVEPILLKEVAEDKERYWTIIENSQQSHIFEEKLVKFLDRYENMASEKILNMLDATATSRSIASIYISKMEGEKPSNWYSKYVDIDGLKVRAKETSMIHRMVRPEARRFYERAIFLMFRFSELIEQREYESADLMPYIDAKWEVRALLELIVDKVLYLELYS